MSLTGGIEDAVATGRAFVVGDPVGGYTVEWVLRSGNPQSDLYRLRHPDRTAARLKVARIDRKVSELAAREPELCTWADGVPLADVIGEVALGTVTIEPSDVLTPDVYALTHLIVDAGGQTHMLHLRGFTHDPRGDVYGVGLGLALVWTATTRAMFVADHRSRSSTFPPAAELPLTLPPEPVTRVILRASTWWGGAPFRTDDVPSPFRFTRCSRVGTGIMIFPLAWYRRVYGAQIAPAWAFVFRPDEDPGKREPGRARKEARCSRKVAPATPAESRCPRPLSEQWADMAAPRRVGEDYSHCDTIDVAGGRVHCVLVPTAGHAAHRGHIERAAPVAVTV